MERDRIEIEKRIKAIMESDSNDFLELTRIAGYNPKEDFQNCDLNEANFDNCDLSGFNFTGSLITNANFSGAKISNTIFDTNQKLLLCLQVSRDYDEFTRKNNLLHEERLHESNNNFKKMSTRTKAVFLDTEDVNLAAERELSTLARNVDDIPPLSRLPTLIKASEFGHLKAVEALIKKGVDLDECYEEGITALMIAAAWGQIEIIDILCKNGAKTEIKSKKGGWTALIFAAHYHFLNTVQQLLHHGADPTMKDNNGLTAANHALQKDKKALFDILKSAEIDWVTKQ